jgi:hypothetical protein
MVQNGSLLQARVTRMREALSYIVVFLYGVKA